RNCSILHRSLSSSPLTSHRRRSSPLTSRRRRASPAVVLQQCHRRSAFALRLRHSSHRHCSVMARKRVKRTATASRTEVSHGKEIAIDEEKKQTENKNETFKDPEVERQIAAIRAICDMETEHLLTGFRLVRSYLNKEQLQAPVLQFLEENLPNVSVMNESDGQVDLKWKHQEDTFSTHNVDAKDMYTSLLRRMSMTYPHSSEVWQPSTGFPLPCTTGSDMLDATNILSAGKYTLGDPYQSLALGVQDGLQTPGANGQRMSIGMTPKTQRHPKQGEMMLSVHGSPLGVYKVETNMESIVESEEV
ncbi:hypothetical protein V2J09_009688, partial [Rumex salicifolius]